MALYSTTLAIITFTSILVLVSSNPLQTLIEGLSHTNPNIKPNSYDIFSLQSLAPEPAKLIFTPTPALETSKNKDHLDTSRFISPLPSLADQTMVLHNTKPVTEVALKDIKNNMPPIAAQDIGSLIDTLSGVAQFLPDAKAIAEGATDIKNTMPPSSAQEDESVAMNAVNSLKAIDETLADTKAPPAGEGDSSGAFAFKRNHMFDTLIFIMVSVYHLQVIAFY